VALETGDPGSSLESVACMDYAEMSREHTASLVSMHIGHWVGGTQDPKLVTYLSE